MTSYHVIVESSDARFIQDFDGEPQINLTFESEGQVYKVITARTTRAVRRRPYTHR